MRGGPGRGGAPAELIAVPPSSLAADLGSLLAGGQGADVTLVVEGEEFRVRREAAGRAERGREKRGERDCGRGPGCRRAHGACLCTRPVALR
jgi:hypothetical protein